MLETFPVVRDRLDRRAGSLSGGEQQMLALSKAVMLEPELLLIDELSLGLAPLVVQQLLGVVEELKAQGLTMVIVEQSVNVALAIADRAVFMERGHVRFEGPAQELLERGDLLRGGVPVGRGRVVVLGFTITSTDRVQRRRASGWSTRCSRSASCSCSAASGVINFAQGQFGAFGASLMAVLYVNEGISVRGHRAARDPRRAR